MSILKNKNTKSVFFASQKDWASEDEDGQGQENAKLKDEKTANARTVTTRGGFGGNGERGRDSASPLNQESDECGESRPKVSINKGQRKREGSAHGKTSKPRRKGRSRSKANRITKDSSSEDYATFAMENSKSQKQKNRKTQTKAESKSSETKQKGVNQEPEQTTCRSPNPDVQKIGCRVETPLFMGTLSPISPSESEPQSPNVPIWRALRSWVKQPNTVGDKSTENEEKPKLPFLPTPPSGAPAPNCKGRMTRRARIANSLISKEAYDVSEKSDKTPSPEDRLALYKEMKKNMYSLN